MPLPNERIQTLRLPNQLKMVSQLLKVAKETIDTSEPHRLDRFHEVFIRAKPLIEDINIRQTAVSVYESISAQLEAARGELQKFTSDINSVDYDNLDETTDNLLRLMPLVGLNSTATERIEGLVTAVTNVQEATLETFKRARDDFDKKFSPL